MNAAAVIDLRSGHSSRLVARLRQEDGIGLIELLIALLVLNVGIFATIGAFTSAATTIRRASHVSTAAAIADKEMEALHNLSYAQILAVPQTPFTWPNAPDGGKYTVQVSLASGQVSGGSANLEQATVTVTDQNDSTAHVTEASTFSRCTQSGLQGDTGQTPCQS